MLPVLFALTWLHRCHIRQGQRSGQRLPQGWIMMVEVVWVCVSPGSNHPQKQPAERCHDGILQNSKASGWDYYGLWQNICHMSILFNIIFLDVTSRSLIKAGHSSSKCWCEKLRCLILLHSSLCWSYYLTLDRYAVDSTPHSMQKPSGVPHKPSKKRCKLMRTLDLWKTLKERFRNTSQL